MLTNLPLKCKPKVVVGPDTATEISLRVLIQLRIPLRAFGSQDLLSLAHMDTRRFPLQHRVRITPCELLSLWLHCYQEQSWRAGDSGLHFPAAFQKEEVVVALVDFGSDFIPPLSVFL